MIALYRNQNFIIMKTSSIIFKNVAFYLFLVNLIALLGCNNQSKEASQTAEKKAFSPIEGNWELVSDEQGGKKITTKKQFKVFNEGRFSFIMFDATGNFNGAGAGSYEVNGNTYKETFKYYSDTKFNGSSDWQEWKMEGDTLVFYGFKKVLMADGKDVTNEWGHNTFVEKRVRAK